MGRNKYNCKYCGKEYWSYKDNSKYCSKECKSKDSNYTWKCNSCGKEFSIYRSKYKDLMSGKTKSCYCSRECANKGLVTSLELVCNVCGKCFTSYAGTSNERKYCSQDCYKKARSKRIQLETKKCVCCGKQFTTYHHNQKYCSKKCAGNTLKKTVIVKCSYCGKDIERRHYEFEGGNRFFCSRSCMNAYTDWPQDDIQLLLDNYGVIPTKSIVVLLNNKYSAKAINKKARDLGITIKFKWSEDEINILRDNYSRISIDELMKLLPTRSKSSIIGKAKQYSLLSYNYLCRKYSDDDVQYLKDNYLEKTDAELAETLDRNIVGISQKLLDLGLHRPISIKKEGYKNIEAFIRAHLAGWKEKVREESNYTCAITGSHSDIIVHHIRGFNLLLEETIQNLSFPIKDMLEMYSDDELNTLLQYFLELQEQYGEYICITKSVHIEFHKRYGYGNNTADQWNEFVESYNQSKIA